MIAVDTNILVYAHREDSEFHEEALGRMLELAEGVSRWAIPWPCIHEFFAVLTHPRIYDPPTSASVALDALRVWMESPYCKMIGEGPGYFDQFESLVKSSRVAGGAIHDARIAAICLHNGVSVLWTADRDFSRFGALATHNPLIS